MSRFAMSVAVLALVLAAPGAMGQPSHQDDHRDNHRSESHQTRAAPQHNDSRAARPAAERPAENRTMTRPQTPGTVNRPAANRARPQTHTNRPAANHVHPQAQTNRPANHRAGSGRDHRPQADRARRDYSKYRHFSHSPRRYHAGTYRAPRGYHYRRWSYGQRMPSIYFGSSFWLTNYLLYGLFAPPPGAVWVRYGPDAVLVDRYTGEVISVQYNAFY